MKSSFASIGPIIRKNFLKELFEKTFLSCGIEMRWTKNDQHDQKWPKSLFQIGTIMPNSVKSCLFGMIWHDPGPHFDLEKTFYLEKNILFRKSSFS